MGCTLFWVKFCGMHLLILWFWSTSQMALLSNIKFYFDCKTRQCFRVPGSQEKIYFCTRKFLSTRYIDDINEQDTSFLDCKHKQLTAYITRDRRRVEITGLKEKILLFNHLLKLDGFIEHVKLSPN